jgi:hypothetical protein
MKKTSLFGALAIALIASSAMAEEPVAGGMPGGKGDREARRAGHEARMKEHIAKVDTNKDGKVDKAEFMAEGEEKFKKMDLNGDGFITDDERKQVHEQRRSEWKAKRGDKAGKAPTGTPAAPAVQ